MCAFFSRVQEIMDEWEPERCFITNVCENFIQSSEKLLKQCQAEFGTNSSSEEETKEMYAAALARNAATTEMFVQKKKNDRFFLISS